MQIDADDEEVIEVKEVPGGPVHVHRDCMWDSYDSVKDQLCFASDQPPARPGRGDLVLVPSGSGTFIRCFVGDTILAPEPPQAEDGKRRYVQRQVKDVYCFDERTDAPVPASGEPVPREQLRALLRVDREGEIVSQEYTYGTLRNYLERFLNLDLTLKGVEVREDGHVPPPLRERLRQGFARWAQRSEVGFHPGSNDMVQDVVHPSLFPYIRGLSRHADGSVSLWQEEKEEPRYWRRRSSLGRDVFMRNIEKSRYQWLPSEFRVDDAGKTEILSYINGLGAPSENTQLYQDVAELFSLFVGPMETCLATLYETLEIEDSKGAEDKQASGEASGDDAAAAAAAAAAATPAKERRSSSLRNRRLQVIVKMVNYLLQPGDSYEGVWHVEGMTEQIICSGIYYMETSASISDKGLAFRRSLTEDEEEEIIMEYRHENPPPFDYSSCSIDLGTVETSEGRCVVFPNNHQHRVQGLQHTGQSGDAVGRRSIVCFFLIDPERPIVSTADVPDQRIPVREIADIIQFYMLENFGMMLPHFLMREIIACYLAQSAGLTLSRAHEHMLNLMKERKVYKDRFNADVEREVSLCEH